MRRLLIVSTIPITLEAFLLPFAKHFKKKGWIVDGAASGIIDSCLCRNVFNKCFDIPWTRDPLSIKKAKSAIREIREICLANKYNIIHVHTPIAAFLTRFALRKIRKDINCSLVYTAHGFHFHKQGKKINNFIFRSIENIASHWTDALITINEEDFQAALYLNKNIHEKCFLFPGIGLDTDFYNKNNISNDSVLCIRETLGLKMQDHLFTMIAEFNSNKRHFDVLKALFILQRPDIHVCFAGTGKGQLSVKKIAEELGLLSQTHFLGFVNDIRPFILASTALILPSEREGLPRCVMESLALNIPVLGSDTRGIRDLLKPFPDTLFPVGDVRTLAKKMEEQTDGVSRSQFFFLDPKYSLENILNLTEDLYTDLLKNEGNEHF